MENHWLALHCLDLVLDLKDLMRQDSASQYFFAPHCPVYTEMRRLWKVKPSQGSDLLELHLLFDECFIFCLLSGMGLN